MRKTAFIAVLIAVLAVWPAQAEEFPGQPLTRQLMFSAVYVKEKVDQAWRLRITGDLPRGPGIHVLIYDEAGGFMSRYDVPWGEYTDETPFTVDVPADGKAQQYVIKVLGQQDNMNGLRLPLTDLPYEVYSGSGFAFGYGDARTQRRIVAFQVADETPIHFSGWRADYRILDAAGATVADSKDHILPEGDPRRVGDMRNHEAIFNLKPGNTYWLDPYGVMYLSVRGKRLYLTFDPERWFEPKLDWSLEDRPWWKGIVNVD